MDNKRDNNPRADINGLHRMPTPHHPFDIDEGYVSVDNELINEIKNSLAAKKRQKIILIRDNPLSRKSALLRNFADSPGILGKNVISTYLDIRQYAEEKYGDMQASIFKILVQDAAKHARDSGEDWRESAPNAFDYAVQKGSSFLLIFDNFDVLVENFNRQTIIDVLKNFQNLDEDWGIFSFIFDWDERVFNYVKSSGLTEFFSPAYKIRIKDFVEEESSAQLTALFDREVICSISVLKEIVQLSGKSLFFQQLISRRILEHMKEKQAPRCTTTDVNQVLRNILNDKRSAAFFPWDKRLSTKNRILIAALADESITNRFGDNSFCIEDEHNILGDILGEELQPRLRNLFSAGFIHGVEDNFFYKYPFKIPLYGKWVREKHPFIKTVIENIEELTGVIDLDSLIAAIEDTPAEKMIPFDKEAILETAKRWMNLKRQLEQKGNVGDKQQILLFLQSLAKLTGLGMRTGQASPAVDFFAIDIKQLDIGMLDEALCIVQDRMEFKDDDTHYIENIVTTLAQEARAKITLFFSFRKMQRIEDLGRKPYLSLITIEENELKKIIFSNRPSQLFKMAILAKLSLSKVSPYHIVGPARATFYGRSHIIDLVYGATSRSFSLVGARKIGKTSLLHKMLDYPHPNSYYIFMDLQLDFPYADSYAPFLQKLEEEIEEKCKQKVSFNENISKIPGIVQELTQKGKNITFIFDEIDGLLQFDDKHQFRLLRIFRAMAQKGSCRFIFAGFKELYKRKREIDNPLYNFGEEIQLAPLKRKAALDLITAPMNSIGIQYKKDEDKELILDYTSCHPNLLQFFCTSLIEKIESHETLSDKRIIYNQDIEEIFDSKYEAYVVEEIYLFFSDLSCLGQLIVILFAEDYIANEIFSTGDTKKRLTGTSVNISIEQVRRQLKNLVMRFILEDKGEDNFCFSLPPFPAMLKKRIDEDFKNKVIREVRENVRESL
ncbi:MAG: hypothetical protein KAW12_31175 [Candidatus Aminicenantes bacterium]|nr:hypothetical protein [Candidatus Aminicenantes bacterium]